MGAMREQGFSGFSAMWMKDADARLVSVDAFDGLVGVSLVREWSADGNGLLEGALADLVGRTEWAPDADVVIGSGRADFGRQGTLRYVPNPTLGSQQWAGLFVGGPVRVMRVPHVSGQGDRRVIRQVLTQVRYAGAGWRLDSAGKVVFDGTVRSAVDALKDCRCSVRRRGVWRKPYRTDVPRLRELELRFRFWTHESRTLLEGLSVADLQSVVDFHLGDSIGWVAQESSFDVDEGTNAGVFALVAVAKTSYAVGSMTDLAAAPMRLEPTSRETLRRFGLRSEAEGEGYVFGQVMVWEDLARSSESVLSFPDDLLFLAAVVDKVASYAVWAKAGATGALCKEAGRVWQYTGKGTGDTFAEMLAAGGLRPWWRVAEFNLAEQEDGLLRFSAFVVRPRWEGGNDAVLVGMDSPGGWGDGRTLAVVSMPTAVAEATAAGMSAPDGYVLGGVQVQESEPGVADVRLSASRVWDYDYDAPVLADVAPEVVRREVGPGDGGMSVRFPRVAMMSADAVRAAAEALVSGGDFFHDSTRVSTGPDGAVEVETGATREASHALPEFVSGGDYFGTEVQDRLLYARLEELEGSDGLEDGGLQADGSVLSVGKELSAHGNFNVVRRRSTAVAREWVSETVMDALDGTGRKVVSYVYRNQAEVPAQPVLEAGERATGGWMRNGFGLWDGEWTVMPHDVPWVAESEEVDYFLTRGSERLFNRTTAPVEVAGQSVNALRSVQVQEGASGLFDSTVTDEVATPRTWEVEFLPDALGVAGRKVVEGSYRNAAVMPTVGAPTAGRRVSASLALNRFGSWDGQVQESPDDRPTLAEVGSANQFGVESSSSLFNRTAATTESSAFTAGKVRRVSRSETLSGLHDSTVAEEEATPQDFNFSFVVKSRGREGTATVYVYYNQVARATITAAAGYEDRHSWELNRFGRYDGRIVRMPTFYDEGGASTLTEWWDTTRVWLESRAAEAFSEDGDGKEYRLVTESASWRHTTSDSNASDWAAAGMSGSESGRVRAGLYWAKKVTAIVYGGWAGTKADAE